MRSLSLYARLTEVRLLDRRGVREGLDLRDEPFGVTGDVFKPFGTSPKESAS